MDADTSHWRIEELLGESSWLSALARELVSDRALADDVAQETWVAALRTPPPRATPLRPWLARVARNFAKQHARGESRRERREVEHARDVANARDADTSSPGVDELSARLEGQRLLVAALGELNEPYRSTVLLVYFEHQTSAEIAQRDGVAESTVRWRLKQALEELRARLDTHSRGDRRQWALALAPLARSTSGASAAAPSFLAGVLAMSLIWKLTAAGVAAVLVCAGLTWSGVVEVPYLSANSGAPSPVDVTFAPVDTSPVADLSVPAHDTAPVRRESSATAPATSGSEVRVRARFLDPEDAPVANVLVRSRADVYARVADGVRARSGTDGRAELVFASLNAARDAGVVRAESPGFALRDLQLTSCDAGVIDLGDVQLELGGSIRGVTRDARGAPLGDVLVGVAERGGSGFRREEARRAPYRTFVEPYARSDARGNFTLSGVPIGQRVLSTERDGYLITFSGSIEVRAGQESRGVELVLDPVPASEIVDGVVLAPDGAPVPNAHLSWSLGGRFGSNGTDYADEHGRFSYAVAPGYHLDLDASDDQVRFAVARVRDVAGGTRGLELRLGTQRTIALDVRDVLGAPVTGYRAWTTPAEGEDEHPQEQAGPPVEFVAPVERFAIVVEAKGHRRWRSDVLDPATVGATVSAVLERMPEITGRVHIGERAAGYTRVSIWQVAHERVTVHGFPSRFDAEPLDAGTSDAEGRFALTVRRRATVVVRCERDGSAPCELGPFDYDPEIGLADLAAVLTPGGAIEGRVRVAVGASTAGKLVAFSRGDGLPFTLRASPDGSFRADHLAPGPWYVVRAGQEIGESYRTSSNTPGDAYRDVPSTCTVVEGETTRYDVPIESPAPAHVIAGTLTIDGAPAAGWELNVLGGEGGAQLPAERRVSTRGTFELSVGTPGRTFVGLSSMTGPLSGANYLASIDVAGPRTEWSADLRQAAIVVGEEHAGDPARPWVIVVSVQPDFHAYVPVPPDAGEHTLSVPAGRAKLVLFVGMEKYGPDPEKWPAQAEITLAAGATGRLSVP